MRGLRLTGRGLTLLVVGVLVAVAAALVGEPDVVWVGLLVVALPLVGIVGVLVLRPRLRLRREVRPPQVALGGRPEILLHLENTSPVALSGLDFADRAPSTFGADAQFSLARGLGRWTQRVGYELDADQRGHFPLGPLWATAHDPLGMAVVRWPVPGAEATLRVTPRVWTLSRRAAGMGLGATGDATPQRIGQAGQDDVLVREHRHGDDLRRVHWRLSAKQGELMVRLEEHPWDPAVTLVIDTRSVAHFGSGPDSTLEWVISLGASVGAELLAARYRVTILSADTEVHAPGHHDPSAAADRMLQRLTDLEASGRDSLIDGLADSDAMGNAQSVIGALGLLGAADAAALSAVGTRMVQCSALVPDAAAFGAAPDAVDAHDDACRLLESAGWTIHRYRPTDSVPDAWSALLHRREAR